MSHVYRIQDREGRGPWRAGFTHRWADAEFKPAVEIMLPWHIEFEHDLIDRRGLPGEHYGCVVRKVRDIARWVSKTEREKLSALGFTLVSIRPDRILAESANQIVFANRTPLALAATILSWSFVEFSVGGIAQRCADEALYVQDQITKGGSDD